jgi:hypothetical protein
VLSFCKRVILEGPIDLAVYILSDCPPRQPSPKKLPRSRTAIIAFLRRVAAIVSLTVPLDIENRVGFVTLRKNDLVVSVAPHSHRRTELSAENCGTETESLIRHRSP